MRRPWVLLALLSLAALLLWLARSGAPPASGRAPAPELRGDGAPRTEEAESVAVAARGREALEPGPIAPVRSGASAPVLVALVLDAEGRPIEGACVVLSWGAFDPFEDEETRRTDASGRMELGALAELTPAVAGRLTVSVGGGVDAEPETVTLDPAHLPADPLRFVVAAHGSVRVHLVDEQGRPEALAGEVSLELPYDEPTSGAASTLATARIDAGEALFPCVGLGRAFDVWVDARGHSPGGRSFAGPMRAGECVDVLVPMRGPDTIVARGRIVGLRESLGHEVEDRIPFRSWNDPGLGWFSSFIDPGDPFELDLLDVLPRSLTSDDRWSLELDPPGGPLLRTTAQPTFDAEQRVLDFGDVRFDPAPLLAELRVLDAQGVAPARAEVEIVGPGESRRRFSCGEDGCMRLAGSPSDLPLRVRARASGQLGEWTSLTAPGAALTLVVRPGASVEGVVRLAGSDEGLALKLEDVSGTEAEGWVTLLPDGRFRIVGCAPGPARLAVTLDERTVFETEPFELAAGTTTTLAPIDLRALLHPFELTFALASGEPWMCGRFAVLDAKGTEPGWGVIGASGRVRFLSTSPSPGLRVMAWGARATQLDGVRDGERVSLLPPPGVRLRLDLPLPPPPFELVARARRWEPEDVPFEVLDEGVLEGAVVNADGTALLRPPWPGTYALRWFVRHAGTGLEFEIRTWDGPEIVVPDSSDAPVVPVELDPEELRAAVARAGG